MLIEFRAANYRSIAEEQILSFVPSKGQSDYMSNVFSVGNIGVLNGAALYGPNNGGKSNLLRALRLMDNFLFTSSKLNSTAPLPYDPNLLIAGYHEKPTGFEVTFLIDTVRYRYGFQFDRKSIHREWLYRKKVGREVELFYREADVIEVSSGLDGKTNLINTAIEATRNNGLFLSFCDMLNVDEAKKIFAWFKRLIHVDGLDTSSEEINTISLIESSEAFKHKILTYLNRLGFSFSDIEVLRKHFSSEDLPEHLDPTIRASILQGLEGSVGINVNTIRQTYNPDGTPAAHKVAWPLNERESEGTKKAFSLSGPVLYTLLNGGILVVDEIEAKLHTKITSKIVSLFLSESTNPLQAQLLFATHDTNLLNETALRRDQIYFVDRNQLEATEIYSLSDFKYFNGNKERPDTDKEKRYLEGRYKAVPIIQDMTSFINQNAH